MASPERIPPQETLLPAEIGQLSFNLMQQALGSLKEIPEFKSAVTDAVFKEKTSEWEKKILFRSDNILYHIGYENRELPLGYLTQDQGKIIHSLKLSVLQASTPPVRMDLETMYTNTDENARFIGGKIKGFVGPSKYSSETDPQIEEKAKDAMRQLFVKTPPKNHLP